MNLLLESWLPLPLLTLALFGLLELGRYAGRRRLHTDPEWDHRGLGTLESTILALLGLLLAFTFSGAWSRFDARRELILKEVNAIGTAWMRLDLLPEAPRARVQQGFRDYVDARLASTRAHESRPSAAVASAQATIWREAVAAGLAAVDGRVTQTVLPALNEMFDLATERYVAVNAHPPAIVFAMLLAITLLAALLVGYSMAGSRRRSWLHTIVFVASLLLSIYVSIDLEYPRRGFVRIDRYDQLLVELRAELK